MQDCLSGRVNPAPSKAKAGFSLVSALSTFLLVTLAFFCLFLFLRVRSRRRNLRHAYAQPGRGRSTSILESSEGSSLDSIPKLVSSEDYEAEVPGMKRSSSSDAPPLHPATMLASPRTRFAADNEGHDDDGGPRSDSAGSGNGDSDGDSDDDDRGRNQSRRSKR